jgi:hypothetical protein
MFVLSKVSSVVLVFYALVVVAPMHSLNAQHQLHAQLHTNDAAMDRVDLTVLESIVIQILTAFFPLTSALGMKEAFRVFQIRLNVLKVLLVHLNVQSVALIGLALSLQLFVPLLLFTQLATLHARRTRSQRPLHHAPTSILELGRQLAHGDG